MYLVAVIKYKLGYVVIPGMGAMPVPPPLFPEKYARANNPLNAWVVSESPPPP